MSSKSRSAILPRKQDPMLTALAIFGVVAGLALEIKGIHRRPRTTSTSGRTRLFNDQYTPIWMPMSDGGSPDCGAADTGGGCDGGGGGGE
jgi:hypothetical protein